MTFVKNKGMGQRSVKLGRVNELKFDSLDPLISAHVRLSNK